MKIVNAKYIAGAARVSDCIVSQLPQIAVVGKSNVGKSSFINFLVNDGKLARTSKSPGRTRLINYFLLNENGSHEFILADLPGYGYAQVSAAEKQKWADLIEKYLADEEQLKHVFFLVDIRHPPTADDLVMSSYLFVTNTPYTVVATKMDKISKSQIAIQKKAIAAALKIGCDDILTVSSTEKRGKEAVLNRIEQVLENL
ncbi:MAG: ribosome biogenesis GTP-binding protein YihA/YsxC [Corallococcus sp.]|nr:ribosome biogenesis GTP-binding protein YihA/YsxC [Corallococcus sp.]